MRLIERAGDRLAVDRVGALRIRVGELPSEARWERSAQEELDSFREARVGIDEDAVGLDFVESVDRF